MQSQKINKKPVGIRDESDINLRDDPFPELQDPFAMGHDDGVLEGNQEYTDQVIQQLR